LTIRREREEERIYYNIVEIFKREISSSTGNGLEMDAIFVTSSITPSFSGNFRFQDE